MFLSSGELKTKVDQPIQLIMAGGYDNRVSENREHFEELTSLAYVLGLDSENEILFLKSPSDSEKLRLLKTSNALLYTPSGTKISLIGIGLVIVNYESKHNVSFLSLKTWSIFKPILVSYHMTFHRF